MLSETYKLLLSNCSGIVRIVSLFFDDMMCGITVNCCNQLLIVLQWRIAGEVRYTIKMLANSDTHDMLNDILVQIY